MTADSWLVVVRSAPAEPNSQEMLELVLAGASLDISLNVVFAGAGRGHLSGQDAAPWRQLIDFGMAGFWCLEGDGPAPDISIDAQLLDDSGFERLRSQAQGILEL